MKNLLFYILLLALVCECKPRQEDPTIPQVSKGRIVRLDNFSSSLVSPRNIDVWLPEEYREKGAYPVLYMNDGQMLFDSTKTWNRQEWGVDEVISRLINENAIEPVIVVGIWNTGTDRHSEYLPQKPYEDLPVSYRDSMIRKVYQNEDTVLARSYTQSDNYLKFLVHELKPYIDKTYSTKQGKENTFIAGSSMGGLISMYAICEYPEIFGGAACLSTHWIGAMNTWNNPIPDAFMNYLDENLPDPANHKLYFDYGTETLDSLYEPYQLQADSIMVLKGFTGDSWLTKKFEGDDHSERSWNKRLHIPVTFLLGKHK